MRPHVSGSCTRVEEPTGDKNGGLERRQGGMGGVSLGDKSSFFMFCYESLERIVSINHKYWNHGKDNGDQART